MSEQSRARRIASAVWGYVVLAAFAFAVIGLLYVLLVHHVTVGQLAEIGVLPLLLVAFIVFQIWRGARKR